MLERRYAAVVDQHRHPVLVDALRLRSGHARADAHPLAALEAQHVVVDARAFARPPVAEEHLATVVGRLHLQRHGQLVRDINISGKVVFDDSFALRPPGEHEGCSKNHKG